MNSSGGGYTLTQLVSQKLSQIVDRATGRPALQILGQVVSENIMTAKREPNLLAEQNTDLANRLSKATNTISNQFVEILSLQQQLKQSQKQQPSKSESNDSTQLRKLQQQNTTLRNNVSELQKELEKARSDCAKAQQKAAAEKQQLQNAAQQQIEKLREEMAENMQTQLCKNASSKNMEELKRSMRELKQKHIEKIEQMTDENEKLNFEVLTLQTTVRKTKKENQDLKTRLTQAEDTVEEWREEIKHLLEEGR